MQAFPGQATYRSHPNGITSVNHSHYLLALATTNKYKINREKLPKSGWICEENRKGMCVAISADEVLM
jgi:hypothetical protein